MSDFAAAPGAVAAFLDGASRAKLYLRPSALVSGCEAAAAVAAGRAAWLAGGPMAFTLCELIARHGDGEIAAVAAPFDVLRAWRIGSTDPLAREVDTRLAALSRPRPEFAGLPLVSGRARAVVVMGIVNVTPDSFSDGGLCLQPEAAIGHGRALLEAGAQIVDVGGESTRPGADAVAVDEELRRVLPVVRALATEGATVSIDTRHAAVMAAAVAEGACIINDVTALTGEAESLGVAAQSGAPVVLMHMQGTPTTMQDDPRYDCAPLDVFDYLEGRIAACGKAGIARERIVVDPGIGFGKTKRHNAEILTSLALYQGLGCGVMIGVSRKSFVAGASTPPEKRLPGSLAAALSAVGQGVQMLRVHDVAETRQALSVWDAIHGWEAP
jgi:dihydropteroate synthase